MNNNQRISNAKRVSGPVQLLWLVLFPPANVIEIEPIPDDSVGKYRAEGVEWAI